MGDEVAQVGQKRFLLGEIQPAGIVQEAADFLRLGSIACVLRRFCHFHAIFLGRRFLQAHLALLIYAAKPEAFQIAQGRNMKPKPKG